MNNRGASHEPLLKESILARQRSESPYLKEPQSPYIKEEFRSDAMNLNLPADQFWRYVALPVGFLLCLMGGTLYGWSVMEKDVQAALDMEPWQTTKIFSYATIGQYIGFVGGFLADRFGPAATVAYGAVLVCLGYTLMWTQINYKYSHSEVLFGFYYSIVGQGSVSMYMGSLVTVSRNYNPKVRGLVVGVLASGFGLSSAVWQQVHNNIIPGTGEVLLKNYILTLVVCTAVFGIMGVICLRLRDFPVEPAAFSLDEDEEGQNVPNELRVLGPDEEWFDNDVTGWKLFVNIDFYLLMIAFLFACGSSLMYIGNLGKVALAMDYKSFTKFGVTLQAFCNSGGRLLFGAVSDLTRPFVGRAFWCLVAAVLLAAAHLGYSLHQELWALYTVTIVNGACYGGLFALTPVFISERFGAKNFGFNWGVGTIFLAIGNFGVSAIASMVLAANTLSGETDCKGTSCFGLTLKITAGLTLFSALLYVALGLHNRRRFKTKLI